MKISISLKLASVVAVAAVVAVGAVGWLGVERAIDNFETLRNETQTLLSSINESRTEDALVADAAMVKVFGKVIREPVAGYNVDNLEAFASSVLDIDHVVYVGVFADGDLALAEAGDVGSVASEVC